jgi:hypothetical protein
VRKQIVDITMAEFQSHVVRRQAKAEGPIVDMERRHRCVAGLVDSCGDRLWINIEHTCRQRNIAEASRHEYVGIGAALEKRRHTSGRSASAYCAGVDL